jgi:hypothetical protein
VAAATVLPRHGKHRSRNGRPIGHSTMPYIRTPDEDVSCIQRNTHGIAMGSFQNELRISVEPFVRTGYELDCSVLNNRIDDGDVDDYEIA